MRGGLLTTDLDGRILLLNRAGAEITGHGLGITPWRARCRICFPDSGLWSWTSRETRGLSARKSNFARHAGHNLFLGLSISLLRSAPERQASGFVFNFQDLTELKRLEREVVTKERMAALGRLSAAIAHEIRQPLTAMTGALKELARLAPLEDDDKKLVQIVSRESQRLNQIITDFLDYSREKTYNSRTWTSPKPDRRNAAAARAGQERRRQISDRAPVCPETAAGLRRTATP